MDELKRRREQLSDPEGHLKSLEETNLEDLTDAELSQLKQSQEFENQLVDALNISVPDELDEIIILNQRLKNKRNYFSYLAVAASFLAVSFVALVSIKSPETQLSQEALAHVYNEIDHLSDNKIISPEEIKNRLEQLQMSLPQLPEKVIYASKCGFAGQPAMHLVAEVDGQPVTLLITPNDIEDHQSFGDQRFIGKMRKLETSNLVIISEDYLLVDKLYQQLKGV